VQRITPIAFPLLAWGGLLAWRLTADRLGCPAAAVALVLASGLLTLSGTEVAFYRRHAFVSHYLQPDGLLFRLLGRRTLMLILQGAQAVALAFLLLIAALSFGTLQWLLLLGDLFLLAALVKGFSTLLAGEVRLPYRRPMARHWAVRANAVLLWVAWILLAFYLPDRNYAGLRWEEVIAFSAAQPSLGCDALALLARFGAVGNALALWGAQHLLAGLRQPAQVLMAWTAFLAAFGASFLVTWAYGRLLVGTVSKPWEVWRAPGERDEADR
jgi:hypothetical protein